MLLVAASTAAAPPKAPAWNAAVYASAPTDNWMAVGGDVRQQHYSALAAIDSGNVGRLGQVWTTHLDGSGMEPRNSQEATPLEYAGVLYVVTGNDDVFALDATNGTHLWTYHAGLPAEMTSVCCGWVSRGFAMGDGKIFVAQLDGNVVALDQSTGAVVWKTANMRWQDGSGMTSAPVYDKGLVYVGSTGGEFDIRGSITAYDATNGTRVWRFYTIPQPGEIGSGSWPDNDEWKTGGATVWDSPSVDPATGTYRWHFQMVHHDIWDFDCPSPTVVFDATYVCAIVTEAAKISAPVPFVPGHTITSAKTANAIYPYHYGYGGTLSALDVATDKIAWQIKTPPGEPCYSGSLSTAGNLVFWGHNNGDFEADDARSGRSLWKVSLPNGADAPP